MSQEQAITDILEIVGYMKDHMVSHEDLQTALSDNRYQILSHVDSFIGLHQKLDTELAALRAKADRLEGFVRQLAAQANIKLEY